MNVWMLEVFITPAQCLVSDTPLSCCVSANFPAGIRAVWVTVGNSHLHVAVLQKKKKSIKKTIIIITRPCGDECKRALCCQLLPINICQWRWEEAKTNGSFICAAKQTIWILSTWVMLIVLSSIIGQSVGHHQVDLRSLSPSVPSWARWALH